MNKSLKIITVLLCLILLPFIFAACFNFGTRENINDTTTTAGTSVTTAESETTIDPTSGHTSTIPPETSTTTVIEETTEPDETTMPSAPVEDIDYQVLPANENITIDLNGDGVYEEIHYTCLDEFSFNLTINSETRRYEGELFLPDYFFLINLDNNDSVLDIAVQELGPSDDYQVLFFHYEGTSLIQRGTVPGLICDPTSETIDEDPFGLGTIAVDGQGLLQGMARGQILHTWFYPELWSIGTDNLLRREHQAYVTMYTYAPDTGGLTSANQVELLFDLTLTEEPGSTSIAGIAKTGETARLIKTDNQSWVQLRTESGLSGWFQVTDFFFITINGDQIFADEVFAGLSFAD